MRKCKERIHGGTWHIVLVNVGKYLLIRTGYKMCIWNGGFCLSYSKHPEVDNILSYSARAEYNKRILYLSFYHFCRGRKKDGSHLQQQTQVLYWPQLLSRPLHYQKEVQHSLNMWQLDILHHTGTSHPAKKKKKRYILDKEVYFTFFHKSPIY